MLFIAYLCEACLQEWISTVADYYNSFLTNVAYSNIVSFVTYMSLLYVIDCFLVTDCFCFELWCFLFILFIPNFIDYFRIELDAFSLFNFIPNKFRQTERHTNTVRSLTHTHTVLGTRYATLQQHSGAFLIFRGSAKITARASACTCSNTWNDKIRYICVCVCTGMSLYVRMCVFVCACVYHIFYLIFIVLKHFHVTWERFRAAHIKW